MKPAIFLDRDGVLSAEKGYVCSIESLEIFEYTRKSVDLIHEKGYWAIVLTNQSAVARGFITLKTLKEINDLVKYRTGVDDIFFCPHHFNKKDKGNEYNCECICRKPKIGLIIQALEKYQDIDMSQSYMVGDRASDIRMGKNAGIKTVLLESGYGKKRLEETIEPDFYYQNLLEFVKDLPMAK